MLSNKEIAALPIREKAYIVAIGSTPYECPGYVVAVNPSGRKSFHYRDRLKSGAAFFSMILGTFPTMLVKVGYDAYRPLKVLRDLGGNPAKEREDKFARERQEKDQTVDKLWPKFLADYLPKRKADEHEIQRQWRVYLKPNLPMKPVAQLTDTDMIALKKAMIEKHGLASAGKLWSLARMYFGWLRAEKYIATNPCDGIEPPAKVKARARVLSDAELRLVYRASEALPQPYRSYLLTLMYTAQRRSEIAGLRREELDPDLRLATIPAERMKMAQAHEVPLVDEVWELLTALPDHGPYLFATGYGEGCRPLASFGWIKRRLLEEMAKIDPVLTSKMAQWGLHDLRRTARTRMSGLKVLTEISERTIGHSPTGIVGVYDLHLYRDEKRDALTRWAAELGRIVRGEPPKSATVIEFKSNAA